jgi:hypothetical protein
MQRHRKSKTANTESPSLWIKLEVQNMVNEVGSRPKCKAEREPARSVLKYVSTGSGTTTRQFGMDRNFSDYV